MFERDFILRQVAQMVQALAAVLSRRREGDGAGAQDALADGVQMALGRSLDDLRALSQMETEALVTEDGRVSAEKAVALADLLREDVEVDGRVRARWLYGLALEVGGPVPFDVQARIEALPEAP